MLCRKCQPLLPEFRGPPCDSLQASVALLLLPLVLIRLCWLGLVRLVLGGG